MQAGRSAFFVSVQKRICFPLLSGKGLGLPAFCRKAALKGLAGQKISSSLRSGIFPARPCAKGNPRGRRPIKSGKHIPMGLFIHKIKDYETTDYQKDWQTCNSDIPDYRNMSADKQRDCPHRDDYAAVACRRILRFPVQDTGHYFKILILLFIVGLFVA